MDAEIKVKIKPFNTPNFVLLVRKASDQQQGTECLPLSDFSPETLEKLCEEFTNEVFKKAGKQQPPRSKY